MLPGINGIRLAFEKDHRFQQGLMRLHGEKTESVFNNWYSGWHKSDNLTWDMRLLLGQIHCPVLVVQGLEDEHATPQHARDIAKAVPKAELWLVECASHMLPQEMPDIFNQRIISFLQSRKDSVLNIGLLDCV
jgi:pimeloyl-ACP methyl ester carboxylesterase